LDSLTSHLRYLIIIFLQEDTCAEGFELDKFLRNSLLIVLLIPFVFILSYYGIIPTPVTETAAVSFLMFVIFLVIIGIVLLGLYYAFVESMARSKAQKKYSDPDPTQCRRVVKDGIDGADYLISGPLKESFGQACRNNWQFEKTDKHSSWIVKDERGNDITNSPLESYDSIAMIVGTFGSEYFTGESESDIPSEYTSIEDGTEYYD